MRSDLQRRIGAQIAGFLFFSLPLAACCAQDPCLSLGSPVLTNNHFQFSLNVESGGNYVIESSPDLVNWPFFATNCDSSISRLIVLDLPNIACFYPGSPS